MNYSKTLNPFSPDGLQIWCRRYYDHRKRPLHADTWPIDSNAATPVGMRGHDAASCLHIPANPRQYAGKTGATPYFLPGKIGSCTGFSGQRDGS